MQILNIVLLFYIRVTTALLEHFNLIQICNDFMNAIWLCANVSIA